MAELESTTIKRGKQTVFIREHDSIDPFEWLGACSRMGGITEPLGDVTWSECQDVKESGKFVPDQETVGSPGAVTSSLMMKKSIANTLQVRLKKCRWDIDARYQVCERRDDAFNWVNIDRLCGARLTELGTDDETAYSATDDGEVIVTGPTTSPPPLIHIWRLTAGFMETTLILADIEFVAKCQDELCAGDCGPAEDCFLIAGTEAVTGHPYLLVSDDGGLTWTADAFDGTGGKPDWANGMDDGACLPSLHIVVSQNEAAYTWATDVDGVWPEVAADDEGNAIDPVAVAMWSPSNIYMVGANGYIWKSTDGGASVSVSDAGNATTEDLFDIAFVTDKMVVAVGENNAIVQTENGGVTWVALDGPAAQVGIDINVILPLDKYRWLIGYGDGTVWITDDGAETWTEDTTFTAVSDVRGMAECGCGRIMLVGEDNDGDGVVYENVDAGAPGRWFIHGLPAGAYTAQFNDVVCCDQNHWIVVGDTSVYLSGYGTILVLA